MRCFSLIFEFMFFHITKLTFKRNFKVTGEKLQILKYEVILLLLIVYYMKQVPEANWRPSFRLKREEESSLLLRRSHDAHEAE